MPDPGAADAAAVTDEQLIVQELQQRRFDQLTAESVRLRTELQGQMDANAELEARIGELEKAIRRYIEARDEYHSYGDNDANEARLSGACDDAFEAITTAVKGRETNE